LGQRNLVGLSFLVGILVIIPAPGVVCVDVVFGCTVHRFNLGWLLDFCCLWLIFHLRFSVVVKAPAVRLRGVQRRLIFEAPGFFFIFSTIDSDRVGTIQWARDVHLESGSKVYLLNQ
jgi:hypothetical protein